MPADAKKKLGGIVVVHENRGLNPHIEDVARRAALAGFVSIAPDALTPLGGYPVMMMQVVICKVNGTEMKC
jgi:carboxymethylenebutenolidase